MAILLAIPDFLFGCHHLHLSRVFTLQGETYRVRCDCGARFAYSLETMSCFNDQLAIGAMHRLLDEGLRVPEDVAVIGCGNVHYGDSLRIPLSTMEQRIPQIAKEATRITLRALGSKVARKPQIVVLKPQLVVRAWTQRSAARHSPSAEALTSRLTAGEMPLDASNRSSHFHPCEPGE